jgi:hypothetical protein
MTMDTPSPRYEQLKILGIPVDEVWGLMGMGDGVDWQVYVHMYYIIYCCYNYYYCVYILYIHILYIVIEWLCIVLMLLLKSAQMSANGHDVLQKMTKFLAFWCAWISKFFFDIAKTSLLCMMFSECKIEAFCPRAYSCTLRLSIQW